MKRLLFIIVYGAICVAGGVFLARESGINIAVNSILLPDLAKFDRNAYLPEGWADQDGDCQDTRVELLIAFGIDVQLDDGGCQVQSGKWRDEFSGAALSDLADIVIVHVVSPAEAHLSGASAWNDATKQAFANDFEQATALGFGSRTPLNSNLVVVSKSTQSDKATKNPAQWLPEDLGRQCHYVQLWVAIKAEWKLTMEDAERDAIADVLSMCPWEWQLPSGSPITPELSDLELLPPTE